MGKVMLRRTRKQEEGRGDEATGGQGRGDEEAIDREGRAEPEEGQGGAETKEKDKQMLATDEQEENQEKRSWRGCGRRLRNAPAEACRRCKDGKDGKD